MWWFGRAGRNLAGDAMNLELSDDQRMISQGVNAILERLAGPDRCRAVLAENGYDSELESVLAEQGYLGMFSDPDAGPLEAVLMVEQVAKALGSVAVGALAVVGPALGAPELRGPVGFSIRAGEGDVPIRFAASPGSVLIVDRGEAFLCDVVAATPRPTSWSYPADEATVGSRRSLGAGSGDSLTAWWRITIAAEIVGNATSCLEVLLAHIKERHQFGRSLATLQALQHRLALLDVQIEGSRWLTYRAAWSGASSEDAAAAAAHSVAAGRRTVRECHQICGALGLTTEFDLHMWTMRIRALCGEAGGLFATQVDAGRFRWRPRSVVTR
jgi:alkylation response protein AidB-like acyl-CoA dehydrogenase